MGWEAGASGRMHLRESGWGRETGRRGEGSDLANPTVRRAEELQLCKYLQVEGREMEE